MAESEGAKKGREYARAVFELALPESRSIAIRIVGHKDGTHTVNIRIKTRAKVEQLTLEGADPGAR